MAAQAASQEARRLARHPALGRQLVGGFFLVTGGIHVGIVAADTEFYRHFADAGLFGFVREGWAEVFMARPAVWGLLLAAGEITLGVLLLVGGRAAPWGWAGVIGFTVLLGLFGFGFWSWCLPALALLGWLAHRDHVLSAAGTMAPDPPDA